MNKTKSIKRMVKEIFMLTRLFMCGMAFFGVLAGFHLANQPISKQAIIGAIAMFLTTAAGFVLDDIFDVRQDTLNEPSRPLPSGAISMAAGWVIGFCSLLSGITVSQTLGTIIFRVMIGVCLMVTCYPAIKYWKAVVGNVVVAVMCCSCYIIGPIAVGNHDWRIFTCLAVVFLYIWGREIGKDAPQRRGDQIVGLKTLAVIYGEKRAYRLSCIIIATSLFINLGYLVLRTLEVRETLTGLIASALAFTNIWIICRLSTYQRKGRAEQFLRFSALTIPVGIAGWFL